MKFQEANTAIAILTAWQSGSTIQRGVYFCHDDRQSGKLTWHDVQPTSDLSFRHPIEQYRIKPSPVLRPWKPEEVPVGALLGRDGNRFLCVGVVNERVLMGNHVCGDKSPGHTTQSLADEWRHSLDGGKTWKPCGVEETT